MELDCNELNRIFTNSEGPESIEVGNGERTNLNGKHIGWSSDNRHTEETKKLIGSYHKGKVLSDKTKQRISLSYKGKRCPNNGASGDRNAKAVRWILHHECGKVTDIVGIANWCKENGYRKSAIYDIAAGRPGRNRHKDIIKVEKLNKP